VVGADLEGLVSAHDEAGLLVFLVLQETDITGTTLLPLLALTVELEKLGTHLEHLLLELLVGLGLDLLSQADDGLEVDIGGFRGLILGVLMQKRYKYFVRNPLQKLSGKWCGWTESGRRMTTQYAGTRTATPTPAIL
jgi:hypothetical protein